jgi:sugar transferase (PEP-CTERM/EpsH1 system associated)
MSKRILFIVPYVPNLIRVRPYNLIRYLARGGSRITLLTLWGDEHERQSLQELVPYVEHVIALPLARWRSLWNCVTALPSRKPLQSVYCWEPGLAHELRALVQSSNGRGGFDAVHVEHLRGAQYGLHLKSLVQDKKKLPVVWDSVDSISMLFRQAMVGAKSLFSRSLTRFELGRTESYEGWLVSQFDHVTVTSPADRRALEELLPAGVSPDRITVLPNGVDLDYFKPDARVERAPDTLVISGKMSYHANVTMVLHFVETIMPRVWEQRPQVKLYVVGKDPAREVQALTADPRIVVTGTVQHLPPYLQAAAVAVAPIAYGAGIQNKVLEAMGCQTPVVASPQAVSALQAVPGQDLMVADAPEAFAQAVLRLLEDADLRQKVGQAGRCYVESHHYWPAVAARLEQVYEQAIQHSAG